MTRKAKIRGHGVGYAKIKPYLPDNYRITQLGSDDEGAYVMIEGEDEAGWTLDDYVIPRLASGLWWAKEVA